MLVDKFAPLRYASPKSAPITFVTFHYGLITVSLFIPPATAIMMRFDNRLLLLTTAVRLFFSTAVLLSLIVFTRIHFRIVLFPTMLLATVMSGTGISTKDVAFIVEIERH